MENEMSKEFITFPVSPDGQSQEPMMAETREEVLEVSEQCDPSTILSFHQDIQPIQAELRELLRLEVKDDSE